jgi:hypothetical protein
MRRVALAAAAVVALLPLLTGCSGAAALRAEELLRESSQAQQLLRSETFTGRITASVQGQDFVVNLHGGAYLRGPHAGDLYVDVDIPPSTMVPVQVGTIRLIRRGAALSMTLAGRRLVFPAPASSSRSTQSTNAALAGLDLAKYVKDVKVEEGRMLAGASVAKVTGILDTASLVKAFSALDTLSAASGQPLPDVSGSFGDTRVVAYFSERTHRLLAALVDLSVHANGQSAQLHFDLGFQRFNKPVAFPAS